MAKHKKGVSGELGQICPAIWIPVKEAEEKVAPTWIHLRRSTVTSIEDFLT
jgi:hypothetical protein